MLQKRYLFLSLEALEFHHGIVEPEGPAAPAPGDPPPLPRLLSLLLLLVTPGLGAGLSAEAAVTT